MSAKQEISDPKMVIATVLRYIDENQNQVSSWSKKAQQEQGLQEFIAGSDKRLMKSKSSSQGLSTGNVHTGSSLRVQLNDCTKDQKKNLKHLFTEGLDVLPLILLVEFGLRSRATMMASQPGEHNSPRGHRPKPCQVLTRTNARNEYSARRRQPPARTDRG